MIETIKSWLGWESAEVLPMPKPNEPQRSPLWPRVRNEHLAREPECLACGCRERKLLNVHHILPFSWPGGKELELVRNNLVTLCESPTHHCHLYVGHLGDFRSRNPNVLEDAKTWRAKIESRPYPDKA